MATKWERLRGHPEAARVDAHLRYNTRNRWEGREESSDLRQSISQRPFKPRGSYSLVRNAVIIIVLVSFIHMTFFCWTTNWCTHISVFRIYVTKRNKVTSSHGYHVLVTWISCVRLFTELKGLCFWPDSMLWSCNATITEVSTSYFALDTCGLITIANKYQKWLELGLLGHSERLGI